MPNAVLLLSIFLSKSTDTTDGRILNVLFLFYLKFGTTCFSFIDLLNTVFPHGNTVFSPYHDHQSFHGPGSEYYLDCDLIGKTFYRNAIIIELKLEYYT